MYPFLIRIYVFPSGECCLAIHVGWYILRVLLQFWLLVSIIQGKRSPVIVYAVLVILYFQTSDRWEVLLHVKRGRVRVTSDSGAQIRYTSRSRSLIGFATRRDVSADKQAHQYQQMTRQQPIKHIRKQE